MEVKFRDLPVGAKFRDLPTNDGLSGCKLFIRSELEKMADDEARFWFRGKFVRLTWYGGMKVRAG